MDTGVSVSGSDESVSGSGKTVSKNSSVFKSSVSGSDKSVSGSDKSVSGSGKSVSSDGSGVSVTDGGVSDSGVSDNGGDGVGNGLDGGDGDGGSDGNGVVLDGGGVGGVVSGVDMGSLNDLLDGVDLVGGGDLDGAGHLNGVWPGDMLVDDDLTGNSDGHIDGHINVVLDNVQFGNDLGDLRGDDAVGPHGSQDPLMGDGISGGGAKVDGSWGDGGVEGGVVDHWGSNWHGDGAVSGLSSQVGVAGLRDGFDSGDVVSMSGLDLLDSDLSGFMSDDSILDMVLNHGGSSGVAVVGLTHGDGGGYVGSSGVSKSSVADGSNDSGVAGVSA